MNTMKATTAQFINPTRSTAFSRKMLKRTLASVKAGSVRVWGSPGAFRVTVSRDGSNTYTSCPFDTLENAVCHIFKTAANTGFDLAKFGAMAARYLSRFGFPRH